MSTDPNDSTADSFLRTLQFNDLGPFPMDGAHELRQCCAAHSSIWDVPDNPNYTDHGFHHSERIVQHFMCLDARYHWSEYEKMIFGMASLMHDIGMQYRSWSKQRATLDATQPIWQALGLDDPSSLSEDDIREKHIPLGHALIDAELNGLATWSCPSRWCSSSERPINCLFEASLVAFAHGRGRWWDEIGDPDLSAAGARMERSEKLRYRPRLLAGMLRLCDELEGVAERVRKPDHLWSDAVPNVSRLHWLSCFFVEEVKLNVATDGVLGVTLKWRVPRECEVGLRDAIGAMLSRMRRDRIEREASVVNGMFKAANDMGYTLLMRIDGLESTPRPFAHRVTARLAELIVNFEKHLADATPAAAAESIPRVAPTSPVSQLLAGAVPQEDPSALGAVPPNEDIKDTLRRWFYETRQGGGHFELAHEARIHTDTFLHCRSLVSDQALVHSITEHLWNELNGAGVSVVVGVGTSAITLAVSLAFRFGADVTFTFSEAAKHYRVERRTVIDPARRGIVLVVDDVIARGMVAEDCVKELTEHHGVRPDDIIHVCLFRLGTQTPSLVPGVRYIQLCEIEKVSYWDPPCPLCAEQVPLVRENEM